MAISYLVDHHDGQQIADCREEEAIEVVADPFTDSIAEDIQNHLSNNEEENTKGNITQRPTVFERPNNQQDLTAEVDEEHDRVYDVGDDEDADGVLVVQAGPILESEQRHSAGDDEHGE